ncbi:MAG: hypothetical protein U5K72_02985 [Balneolaceae bacterium]|nr:hypothetical protein [Balneolaceae bacterium]
MTTQKLKKINTVIFSIFLIPVTIWSQPHSDITVQGEVSGFDCAVVEVLCPTTHRGADYTNGIFTEEKEFFFVVNIPQSFLRQYFRETFVVEGAMYEPYTKAVEPETIQLIENGERRLVYESGYFIDGEGRRATFQDGVVQNGEWTVEEE